MPLPGISVLPHTELTPRETMVLELISQGYQYAEIAHKLGLSPHTIKNHTVNIRTRLDARTNAHAVAKWLAL